MKYGVEKAAPSQVMSSKADSRGSSASRYKAPSTRYLGAADFPVPAQVPVTCCRRRRFWLIIGRFLGLRRIFASF